MDLSSLKPVIILILLLFIFIRSVNRKNISKNVKEKFINYGLSSLSNNEYDTLKPLITKFYAESYKSSQYEPLQNGFLNLEIQKGKRNIYIISSLSEKDFVKSNQLPIIGDEIVALEHKLSKKKIIFKKEFKEKKEEEPCELHGYAVKFLQFIGINEEVIIYYKKRRSLKSSKKIEKAVIKTCNFDHWLSRSVEQLANALDKILYERKKYFLFEENIQNQIKNIRKTYLQEFFKDGHNSYQHAFLINYDSDVVEKFLTSNINELSDEEYNKVVKHFQPELLGVRTVSLFKQGYSRIGLENSAFNELENKITILHKEDFIIVDPKQTIPEVGDKLVSVRHVSGGEEFEFTEFLEDIGNPFQQVNKNFTPGEVFVLKFKKPESKKIYTSQFKTCDFDTWFDFYVESKRIAWGNDDALRSEEHFNLFKRKFKEGHLIGHTIPYDLYELDTEERIISSFSTTVKKEKVLDKNSFNVTADIHFDNQKKIADYKIITFVFDVTDFTENKYYKFLDANEDLSVANNFNVPVNGKTFDWAQKDGVLYQEKPLKSLLDFEGKFKGNLYVFPYDQLSLPFKGERKLEFRTYVCKHDQKFNFGKPIDDNGQLDCIEEHTRQDYEEEYKRYPLDHFSKILKYTVSVINIHNNELGYLEINKNIFYQCVVQTAMKLMTLDGSKVTDLGEIKAWIRYKEPDDNRSRALKTLQIKKAFEGYQPEYHEQYLKKLTANSRIYERYEAMDLFLNIAVADDHFTQKKSKFLDQAAKIMNLNLKKYTEIKSVKIATVKQVEQNQEVDESVFGITDEMSNEEKCKTLRQQYTKWNAQTNNSNEDIKKRAKQLVELAAKLRTEYRC